MERTKVSYASTEKALVKRIEMKVRITDQRDYKFIEVEKESGLFKSLSKDFNYNLNSLLRGKELGDYSIMISNYLKDPTLDWTTYYNKEEMPKIETLVFFEEGTIYFDFIIRDKDYEEEMPF